MKMCILKVGLILISCTLLTSCGGKKEKPSDVPSASQSEVPSQNNQAKKEEPASNNEKLSRDKIEKKVIETKDKVVKRVEEGIEASKPVLDKVKNKVKENLDKMNF